MKGLGKVGSVVNRAMDCVEKVLHGLRDRHDRQMEMG